MANIIVTNNVKILEQYPKAIKVEGEYIDVLLKVRDLVHANNRLVSHPLGASIRMIYSPIKTILLESVEELDINSVELIESSIEKYNITIGNRFVDLKNKKDYELIDYELFVSMKEEYKNLSKRFNNN